MKFTVADWNEIKDKPLKVLLFEKDMVNLLLKLGVKIEHDELGYWLLLNYDKEEKL